MILNGVSSLFTIMEADKDADAIETPYGKLVALIKAALRWFKEFFTLIAPKLPAIGKPAE